MVKLKTRNFDKKEYWKRRNNTITKDGVKIKKPLRGQGDEPKTQIRYETDKVQMIKGKLVINNRKFRRTSEKLGKRFGSNKFFTTRRNK